LLDDIAKMAIIQYFSCLETVSLSECLLSDEDQFRYKAIWSVVSLFALFVLGNATFARKTGQEVPLRRRDTLFCVSA